MYPITVTYTLTAQDFIDAHRMRRAENPIQRWSMRILYVLVGAVVLAGVVMIVAEPTRATVQRVVPLFLFAAIWLWFVTWFPSRYASRQFDSQTAAQLQQTTEFSDAGIFTRSAEATASRIPWPAVQRFVETDRLFVLYLSPKLFLLYPKRAFSGAELQSFREFLIQRTTA